MVQKFAMANEFNKIGKIPQNDTSKVKEIHYTVTP